MFLVVIASGMGEHLDLYKSISIHNLHFEPRCYSKSDLVALASSTLLQRNLVHDANLLASQNGESPKNNLSFSFRHQVPKKKHRFIERKYTTEHLRNRNLPWPRNIKGNKQMELQDQFVSSAPKKHAMIQQCDPRYDNLGRLDNSKNSFWKVIWKTFKKKLKLQYNMILFSETRISFKDKYIKY